MTSSTRRELIGYARARARAGWRLPYAGLGRSPRSFSA